MIWLDAHLWPALAKWIAAEFGERAWYARDARLREAKGREIFASASHPDTIAITKRANFLNQ